MMWSMSRQMEVMRRASGRWLHGVALFACVLALGGCASGLYANVTSYQHWPADAAGQTYRIVPDVGQNADSLEFQAVADMVRANVGATGLVEAARDQPAQTVRFNLRLQYENPMTKIWTQRYADTTYPWFSPHVGYYGRYWGWGGSMLYAPRLVTVPVQAYRNTLTLWMTDNHADDMEVYRATAIHIGEEDQWIAVMPYLTQAIFDGFPGNNGQVRQVKYTVPE